MGSRKGKTKIPRSGIYRIRNRLNGHQYIGSASEITKRWTVHRFHLRRGSHHSKYLQRAWDKYGENSFKFEVLEACSISRLKEVEQNYLDNEDCEYNVCPESYYLTGYKHSSKTKVKMSKSAKRVAKTQSKLRSERAKRQHAEDNLGRKHYTIRDRVCKTCKRNWKPERMPSGALDQSKYCTDCRPQQFGGYYKHFKKR